MSATLPQLLADTGLAASGADFGAAAEELVAARDGRVLAPLLDLGLIRASGPDAAPFLHNLLTNDVSGLDAGHARLAGLCTPKGRLLAIMLLWHEGDDILLMLPRDILPAILKKLSMYVLRSKVKLTDASAERALFGLADAKTAFGERYAITAAAGEQRIVLDTMRQIVCVDAAVAAERWQALAADVRPVGLAAWHWLAIAAGQPQVVAATQEAFVPQMLNMELPAVGGVNFKKGCYPGQEIVARTQYLGKIKRRTYRARLAEAVAIGADVFAPETGDQHCGAIVDLAPAPGGGYDCLVCVQSGAVEAGEVHVGTPAGPRLEFIDLPYAFA